MFERLQNEVKILQRQYPDISHGKSYEWVIIRGFNLPDGWNRKTTDLMLEIPPLPRYPAVPPDNFYVTEGLRIAENGAQPTGYKEGIEKYGKKWGQFSWHIDGEWHPATKPEDGDNLLTFVLNAEQRLKEVN